MIASLLLATTLLTQVQVQSSVKRDSTGGKDVNVAIRIGAAGDSSYRIPVTAAHLATAFRDPRARTLLEGARAARFRQDSALRSYDAKVFQRISVGMALRATGKNRLVLRDEGVARVRWDSKAGAVVDMLGKRTTVPMSDKPDQAFDDNIRSELSLPIPYFPGREALWMGSSVAQVSVDEGSFVHPLAVGSEAYYQYATGDSLEFTLSDGQHIMLRELRVTARAPHWNVIVGSFWFDQATSQLVRAVYRPSIDLDIWEVAEEQSKRDSSEDRPPGWVRGLISPLKASMEAFSVEYSLFEGRFWLPVTQGAEGKAQASFIHVPVAFEERFVYASVNGPVDVAAPMSEAPPAPPSFNARALRDSLINAGLSRPTVDSTVNARRREFVDTLPRIRATRNMRDSLTKAGLSKRAVDSAMAARSRANGESARAARAARDTVCAVSPDSSTVRHSKRYNGTLDVLLRVPCNLESLKHSPDLPASAYDPGEELFGAKQRDELMGALDFGLQAGWGPQKVAVSWGLGQTRYNRVEGFSTGIGVRQELGRGYAWSAHLRGSQGDRKVNGELGLERGNGRTTLAFNAYHRLVSASDWGTPLTLSSSLPGLLYARDEGFYFRSWGAEVLRTSDRHGQLTWRAFVEQETSAPVTTRFSLFGGSHDDRFIGNIAARTGAYAGGSVRWQQSWGIAPRGWKTESDLRLEGAGGESGYGRGALDLTVSHALPGPLVFGVTGAAGSSVGDVPAQREWFLGSVQTVRGQTAGVAAGDAFWFERSELAYARGGSRQSVFLDLGWAGSRSSDWGKSQRPLSGVGLGTSFLDGLIRTDLSWGIWPVKRRRLDISLEARF